MILCRSRQPAGMKFVAVSDGRFGSIVSMAKETVFGFVWAFVPNCFGSGFLHTKIRPWWFGGAAKDVPHVPFYPQIPTDLTDPIMRTVRKPSLSEKEIMRKNRIKLTLIIASLCGTGSSASTYGQDYYSSGPISSVGRIGDGGVQESANEAALGQDARPTAFRSNVVADDGTGESYSDIKMRSASYGFESMGTSEYAGSSGAAPCGTPSCSSGCSDISTGWFESETLLWWPKKFGGGPLVVGGNNSSVLPTTPLAGGPTTPIGNEMVVGMRLNMGVWADCNQNFGVGARGWGILTDGTNRTFTNGGNSTGIPFFNASIPAPDTFLVNVSAGVNGANTGTIQVKNDLDLVAGELYGRWLLIRDGKSRVDFLSGYTFVRMDSELGLRSQFTDGITNTIQNGTVITTQDTFGTKNQFHGGHIGLLNEVSKGRFTFSAMGKVALGNVRQSSTISGRFTEVAPGGANTAEGRGLFAQNSNIGTIVRNQFTFLPEANAKMKYQLGRAQLGVGYSLLVFPSVAMAGDQIDRNVDIANIGGNLAAPGRRLVTDTFFLHGLDLGLTFSF